jgi:hypothetical protein
MRDELTVTQTVTQQPTRDPFERISVSRSPGYSSPSKPLVSKIPRTGLRRVKSGLLRADEDLRWPARVPRGAPNDPRGGVAPFNRPTETLGTEQNRLALLSWRLR